uniref:Uncharacterized protein n=1 Tax=viral metagenome TaxID=1070528 RepID=A0A6C0ECQ6_9ZZZZ
MNAAIIAPIAVIYPYFQSKAYDYIHDDEYKEVYMSSYEKCKGINRDDGYDKCIKDHEDKVQKYYNKKDTMLILISALSILLFTYMVYRDPSTLNGATGMNIGSMVMIIFIIIKNWFVMKDYLRLFVLGIALAILFYASIKVMQNKKI